MSYRGEVPVGSPPKKLVNQKTFVAVVVTLIILLVIAITIAVIAWFLYRKTLGNLQNNICPVTNSTPPTTT